MINRDFTYLYYNVALSTYANNFGAFLISWLVYDITGSKLAMGSLWMVIIITQLVVHFLVGPSLDNWRRKNVMFVSEAFRLIIFGIILFLAIFNQLNVILLYVCAFLVNVVFYDPAANALIPSIVKRDQLVKANAKLSGAQQFMRLLGILSAGLVTFIGAINSLIFVTIMLFLSVILIAKINENGIKIRERQSWLNQFKEGTVIYKHKPILLYLGLFLAVTNFGIFAAQIMYIPFVYEDLGGTALSYGLFAASWPIGYVIGAKIMSKLPDFSYGIKIRLMMLSLVIGGLTFIFLGFAKIIWVAILIEVIAGLVGPFWNVYSSNLYQVVVPDKIRAQVFSVRFLIGRCATPLGIIFGTAIATIYGISSMFIMVGLITTIIAIFGYFLMRNISKNLFVEKHVS
ncbi:MFS transporter [Shouchella miscanthi]|uniref:MFS transporter n=1 Tax=Shouchella miscanthi TaxID=2598861 RepID=A0ABU6NJ43_9BACI|nr:MFS transporter [Shouchella miscanthi]